MNKQDRVKEYLTKIAESNGMTVEEVQEPALVNIVLAYIESEEEIESED